MILADKIIQLRKKNGWSQEELAEKMNVSRQSVSKWEGAQSVPDLDKILLLAQIFGVSTDFLLKDELEVEEYVSQDVEMPSVKRVSMEDANEFLSLKEITSKRIAFATFLCGLAPSALFTLPVAAEMNKIPMSEDSAGAVGMIVLLIFVAAAVGIFISCAMKTKRFDYLENEVIELEYGVSGMVKEKMKNYHSTYTLYNIIGACICVAAAVPIFAGIIFTHSDIVLVAMVVLTVITAVIGAAFFIVSGVRQESMNKLLQQGDYTASAKKQKKIIDSVSTIYWLSATAIYLAYSFYTNRWDMTWIVWPVAGVLFAAVITTVKVFHTDK